MKDRKLLNRSSAIGTARPQPPNAAPPFNPIYEWQEPTITENEETQRTSRWNFSWLIKWQFWATIVIAIAGTTGFFATAMLLKLPALPSCPTLFVPMASASVRLYCAQLSADKQSLEGLLHAIDLVKELPLDHPMREEIERNIEQWATEILTLAEDKFQAGKLSKAIGMARKIPQNTDAYKLVDERIARWQSIWSKAEAIVAEAEKLMVDSRWGLAFREAAKLFTVGNKHWATTRYEQLVDTIRLAQEESGKLDKAYAAMRRGGSDNLFKAIELAEQIKPESTAYKEAQKLVKEAGEKLYELAMTQLERGDWSSVAQIINRLPAAINKQEEINDLNSLADAGSQAGMGSVAGLEAAIRAAQGIPPGRPLYDRAQKLIGRWQLEIQDINHLTRAEELANSGGLNYLTAAIAQAQLIPRSNPRYSQAQKRIREWTGQIEISEDRPILDRAQSYAGNGDDASLRKAIQEARSIRSGRALYREAQQKIGQWRSTLQRNQDAPYLNEARGLASSGDLPQAVESARRIRPGRVLYDEAQSDVRRWRDEIQGRTNLDRAYQLAKEGTPDGLAAAINAAKSVPSDSDSYNQSVQVANSWSEQLLEAARQRSSYDLGEAIAIARKIPPGTSAYPAARSHVEVWKQRLEPQLPESAPELNNEASTSPSPPDLTPLTQ
ncbi:chromosome segregation ATPase [Lusitaniella coriacea LEGE 07157]|uniref:Chromosome segregation ATPase n=1 Tax=Lusitaniella coriacea LEGE 07157 TaxID=945747 RepID=A0A8J7DSM8_9CYAN|nr:chromosome segregation ATPase [Lusitaniella coriacea]MBE9114397.1 chromosome segregation ATPase [Lusitaniella coriacea LEGE 07157]